MRNSENIDVIMICKPILKAVKDTYDINGSDIEVLTSIRHITLKRGLECSICCLRSYITGHALYNVYPITKRLIELGYVENTGNKGKSRRYYLSLSEKGHEVMRFLTKSIENRMKSLNDVLNSNKKKLNIRIKKNKVQAVGASPLLPRDPEEGNN